MWDLVRGAFSALLYLGAVTFLVVTLEKKYRNRKRRKK